MELFKETYMKHTTSDAEPLKPSAIEVDLDHATVKDTFILSNTDDETENIIYDKSIPYESFDLLQQYPKKSHYKGVNDRKCARF